MSRPSVFWLFWAICFLLSVAPSMPWHGWRGGLLIAAGLMMVAQPPQVALPKQWIALALSVLLLSAMAFLPANWFGIPEWRSVLTANGLALGELGTAHPWQTLESLAAMAICLTIALFLAGHRVDHGDNHRLALAFSTGVALVALVAMAAHEYRWRIPWDVDAAFGFFLNRNHWATLLVMGAITGISVAVQSLRVRTWASGITASAAVAVCVSALVGWSGSRAGILFLAAGFIIWLLLLGRNYVRGRVLAGAGVLAAAGVLYYVSADSPVKKSIGETVGRMMHLAGPGDGPDGNESTARQLESLEDLDLRVPIYRDTLAMIGDAPWTGFGIAQFPYVFPQYRERSAVANDSQSVHPESDWLLMAAEAGLPATLALAALVIVAGVSALRSAMEGRARALRIGCIVAAAIVPLHGLIDVPAHRIELVLPACWLLAISLRLHPDARPASRASRLTFRGSGLAIIAAGVFLVHSQWFGGRAPAALLSPQTIAKVTALYSADLDEQKAAAARGEEREVLPADDKLEAALRLLDDALSITPMDGYLHYLKGVIALYFDDKDDEVDQAFAFQRMLDPTWVGLPLIQARAWTNIDPQRTEELWTIALQRARALDRLEPDSPHGGEATFTQIMHAAGTSPDLIHRAVRAAGPDDSHPHSLLDDWAGSAPPRTLDAIMPAILTADLPPSRRDSLNALWLAQREKAETLKTDKR